MNGLNQMIAQGGVPLKLESPINQMAQIESIRNAQQANMLNQAKMQQLQREQAQTQAVNQLYQQAYDPATGRIDENKLFGGLAQGGFGGQIPTIQEAFAKGRKATAEAGKTETESVLKRLDFYRTQLEGVSTPDQYVQWALSGFDDPILGPALRQAGSSPEKVMTRINQAAQQPNALQNLIQESKVGATKFADLLQQQAGQAITMRGQDIQAATTRRGQDLTERRERDVDLQARIADARTRATETAKNKVAAEAALPSAIEGANEAVRLIDEMIGDARVSKDGKKWEVPKGGRAPAPGFESYVGAGIPGMRFVEGSDTAAFERRQLQIEGQKFLDAFASLRGGGAITEIEGQKATQAILRANKAQSEVEYIKAMREAQFHARRAVESARKKAGTEGAAPGAPAAGAGGVDMNNPLLR
jgi:hypothetical protein